MSRNRPEKRFIDQATQRPFLVARICTYMRKEDRQMCPDEVIDEETCSPACRLLAEELLAVCMEELEGGPERVEQDL